VLLHRRVVFGVASCSCQVFVTAAVRGAATSYVRAGRPVETTFSDPCSVLCCGRYCCAGSAGSGTILGMTAPTPSTARGDAVAAVRENRLHDAAPADLVAASAVADVVFGEAPDAATIIGADPAMRARIGDRLAARVAAHEALVAADRQEGQS